MTYKMRWKFMYEKEGNLVSDYNPNETWPLGKWRTTKGVVKLCENGFHSSRMAIQALGYIQGDVLARVAVRGKFEAEYDKEVFQDMKIARAWRWTVKDSQELAIYAAEEVLSLFEVKYPEDMRPRDAIQAAKKFLKGEISREELTNAATKAYAAAYAAPDAAAAYYAYYAASAANAAAANAKGKAMCVKMEKWIMNRIESLDEITS